MKLLEGKVALITGASRGIGKAIALKFASEGAQIAFTDLKYDEAAQQLEQELILKQYDKVWHLSALINGGYLGRTIV